MGVGVGVWAKELCGSKRRRLEARRFCLSACGREYERGTTHKIERLCKIMVGRLSYTNTCPAGSDCGEWVFGDSFGTVIGRRGRRKAIL